jgi:MSHA pilin protein MshA
MKQQEGFTLIELIVVIVVLGILAATAMPKFSNLAVDARVSKMNGVAGGLKGAAALVNGQVLAENLTSGTLATPASVVLADGSVVSTVWGYPTPDAYGIGHSVDTTGVASTVFIAGIIGQAGAITFTPDINHPNCSVTYFFPMLDGAPIVSSVNVDNVNYPASAIANCS